MKLKVVIMVLSLALMLCGGCVAGKCDIESSEYLRIHIRANSNSQEDQNVKYLVKEQVVAYIADLICGTTTKAELIDILDNNMGHIEDIAESVLRCNGFMYIASGEISNEYFPTRAYGEYVLESDFYDALILRLGTGSGDNWWCVVYPPLCFLNAQEVDDKGFRYKSKIMEMINNFWGK